MKKSEITSQTIDSINNVAFDLVFSDQEKVMEMMRQNSVKAWSIKDTNGYLSALNILGIAFDIKGVLDSSSFYFSRTLELSKLYGNAEIAEKSTNNLGMMNWNKGNLFLAQQYFFSALELSEKQKNEKRTSVALSNIGLIYQELSLYEKSLSFHLRALKIRQKEPELKKTIPLSLNNVAICFEHLNKIDSAIILIQEGLKISREINNMQTEGNLMTTLGNCYFDLQDYPTSLKYCLESIRIKAISGNTINLSKTYNSISEIYLKLGNPDLALEYALKSKEQIKKTGVRPDWIVYNQLSRAYYKLGNQKLGSLYSERSNAIKDSVFSQNHAQAFAELEVMHEAKKKERDLNMFKVELAVEQLKVQTRNQYLLLLGSGLILFSTLSIGFYKKQKFKKDQLQKEIVLRDKLAKAEMQNQLNNERMRISKDLHDNIGSQLTLVTSSLDNLGYKITSEETKLKLSQISSFTKFAIGQLRDSIWVLNRNEFIIEDFHLRVLDYINKAKQSCPEFKFESSFSGDKNLSLTPEQGINLLYVIQEIIHNAIKYSKGKNIQYLLNANHNQIFLEVSDDGNGFLKEKVKIGNGLLNIDNRITKINGTYTLDSVSGKGTKYRISLNI